MRTWMGLAVVLIGACDGGAHGNDAAADAAIPVDAPMSACPTRTAPTGQPEGNVPLSAVKNGDYKISSQLDIDALVGIRVITGHLRVSSPAFDVLSLPDLEIVGGNFLIDGAVEGLTRVELPKLESVGLILLLDAPNAALGELPKLDSVGAVSFWAGTIPSSIPCLRSAPNGLGVMRAATVAPLTFERLEAAGDISVNNTQLTSLAFPALASATNVSILDNPQLVSLNAPALVQAGNIDVRRAPLGQIHFDNLESAGQLTISEVTDVGAFPKLASLSGSLGVSMTSSTTLSTFAMLTSVRSIGIVDNPQLENLGLSSLTTVAGVVSFYGAILDNPKLPTCQAVALSNQVMRSFDISGNDDAGTCN